MIDFRNAPAGYHQGIYDMTFAEYTSIPALNSSKLKQMRKTPAHYKASIEAPQKKITAQQERTFAKGSAFDAYVLDGGIGALKDRVAVEMPNPNRRKKDYREWKEQQQALNKLILSPAEYKNVVLMARAAYKKKRFSDLFESGFPHRVIVWQDLDTGLWCKAEIDWITQDGVVVDLKTTADAGFWFFSKNAYRLGYLNQAAFYLVGLSMVTGVQHDKFLLAAVEVDPPFESHVFRPTNDQIYKAIDQNNDRMGKLLTCFQTGEWPGYPDEIACLETGQYFYDNLDDGEVYCGGF